MSAKRLPGYVISTGFIVLWVAMDFLTGALHPSPGVSPWYPGAGLTVTFLYRFGFRYAPAVVVAEVLRWSLHHTSFPLFADALVGCIIAGIYGLAVYVVRDRLGAVFPARNVRSVFTFCAAAIIASGVVATLATCVFVAYNEVPRAAFAMAARTFWLGDAVGILALSPLLDIALSAARRQLPSAYRRRMPVLYELLGAFSIVLCATVVFTWLNLDPSKNAALVALSIPVAIVAVTGGIRGAAIAAAATDLSLVVIAAITKPPNQAIFAGQIDAIFQTVLALVVGTLAFSGMRLKEHSDWLAFRDPRTALPNRAAFNKWLRSKALRGELWIVSIELDHFSVFDAGMEPELSDAFLREARERVAGAVHAPEFFGRIEPGTFVIARTGSREDALTYANRIADAFREPLEVGSASIRFTVSIGVAAGVGRDGRTLVIEALAAMHEALTDGGNTISVFEAPAGLARGSQLVGEFIRARDNGEFELYFQPIYRLADMRIVGFEELLRWQHPKLGLLSPGSFLPALEASGILDEVESWIIADAARTLAAYERGEQLRVWINLSPRAAMDRAFVDGLPLVFAKAGVTASQVVIEITEQVVASSRRVARITHRLKELGIGVAVDDYGTGHSTLERVHASHADFLKLERSYVSGATRDERTLGVASATIDLANRIGAQAVAEGLETDDQIALFRRFGCAFGQGYGLSEPLSEVRLSRLLLNEREAAV